MCDASSLVPRGLWFFSQIGTSKPQETRASVDRLPRSYHHPAFDFVTGSVIICPLPTRRISHLTFCTSRPSVFLSPFISLRVRVPRQRCAAHQTSCTDPVPRGCRSPPRRVPSGPFKSASCTQKLNNRKQGVQGPGLPSVLDFVCGRVTAHIRKWRPTTSTCTWCRLTTICSRCVFVDACA